VAAQLLDHKLHGYGRRTVYAAIWIIVGTVFVVMAFNSKPPVWTPFDYSGGLPLFLLAILGVWWIYAAFRTIFPARHFRRAYRSFEFPGKSFIADVDETGFNVAGEFQEWRVKWPGVRLRGEDKEIFIFLAGGTLYIFGKRVLSAEQQKLRQFGGFGPA
jgi:YcxB-like protein